MISLTITWLVPARSSESTKNIGVNTAITYIPLAPGIVRMVGEASGLNYPIAILNQASIIPSSIIAGVKQGYLRATTI